MFLGVWEEKKVVEQVTSAFSIPTVQDILYRLNPLHMRRLLLTDQRFLHWILARCVDLVAIPLQNTFPLVSAKVIVTPMKR